MKGIVVAAALAALGGAAAAQDGGIALDLVFLDDSSARLVGMGEWVTVSVYYFGDAATPDAPQEEDGSVYLGGETLQVFPVDQRVTLGGALSAMPAGWTDVPRINVNVFTARFVAEDNLIDCGLVEGPVAEIAAAENVVECRWLEE